MKGLLLNKEDMSKTKKKIKVSKRIFASFFIIILLFCGVAFFMSQKLLAEYSCLMSPLVLDRHDEILAMEPNTKGYYAQYALSTPERIKTLLLKKEDKYFYYHPGINPISSVRAIKNLLFSKTPGGSSTITQQLVKNLLGNEQDRTLKNKLTEAIYTLSLELYTSKDEILTMYINTAYLGNQFQGFEEASKAYFNTPLGKLNDRQILSLLGTLSSPSVNNPWQKTNKTEVEKLAVRLEVDTTELDLSLWTEESSHYSPEFFEIKPLIKDCGEVCQTTIDKNLTEKIREILKRNVLDSWETGSHNGAVVVISIPDNELLAIVGTIDPQSLKNGNQINMALEPRPIGSTVKPFIYAEGFTRGLRPYTNVLDREYKFPIATGFSLYPKNYDGLYHGEVTLHEALSNSLNVPSVKVLEYIELSNFYDLLENSLGFIPLQDLSSYQYGIALGGLEMDLFTLGYLFTLFPHDGILKPIKLYKNPNQDTYKNIIPPMTTLSQEKEVFDPKYTQLVTKILSDRKTGVQQFGLASNLNLPQKNYAVKTGTSRDFHDSWTVSYTPNYVVGVWLGNTENTPLKQITGQSGAGKIWNETMQVVQYSEEYEDTPFNFDQIKEFMLEDSIVYGLPEDDIETQRNLLKEFNLIVSPHEGDTILFENNTSIPFTSPYDVTWFINDTQTGQGQKITFSPNEIGQYKITAKYSDQKETILINIVSR